MLNRRLLRVKVMQALYGLKQAENSDYLLSLDHIADAFAPDLNSMEPQNPKNLKKQREQASELFHQSFLKIKPDLNIESEEIRTSVFDALQLFDKSLKKDKKHYKEMMLEEIDKIYENYIKGLLFLIDIVEYTSDDEEEEKGKYIQKPSGVPIAHNFRNNRFYKLLKQDTEMDLVRIKRNLSWERELIRQTYKNELKHSAEYLEYLKLPDPGEEDDRKILVYTAKNVIFKSKNLYSDFEENDYNWIENQSIVRNLVVKTLKDAGTESEKVLIDISGNWEEDKEFFEELYLNTIEKDAELEEEISNKAQNWDVERIAMTDSIILKMALTEMISFPSIPVKVSINEYIELSKTYSTPKSKQFINGMLDTLSQELIKSGVIRKSGRGLIDNK